MQRTITDGAVSTPFRRRFDAYPHTNKKEKGMFTVPGIFSHHDDYSRAPIFLAIVVGGLFVLAMINQCSARNKREVQAQTSTEEADDQRFPAQDSEEWTHYMQSDALFRKAKTPPTNTQIAGIFKPGQIFRARTLTLESSRSQAPVIRGDVDEKTRQTLLNLALSVRKGGSKSPFERSIGVGNREFKLKDKAMIAKLSINDDITLEFFDGAGVSNVKILHNLLESGDEPLPNALADAIASIYIPKTSAIQSLVVGW